MTVTSRTKTIHLFHTDFDAVTLDEAADRIVGMASGRGSGWVSTVNVAILMSLRRDPRLRDFVDRSAMILADGQPLVWASKAERHALPERVTGIDLLGQVCRRAAEHGVPIALLGAKSDTVSRVAERLAREYPGLRVHYQNGYFSEAEATTRALRVRGFGAKILFVGMGSPRQEHFIEDHWDELGVGVAIGVGGSFDVLSGSIPRAPRFMQRYGLEWLYRMRQEPRRLVRRYLETNSAFFVVLARHLANRVREESLRLTRRVRGL